MRHSINTNNEPPQSTLIGFHDVDVVVEKPKSEKRKNTGGKFGHATTFDNYTIPHICGV